MKKFEAPKMELEKFDLDDIISASGEPDPVDPPAPHINLPCFGQSGNQDANC